MVRKGVSAMHGRLDLTSSLCLCCLAASVCLPSISLIGSIFAGFTLVSPSCSVYSASAAATAGEIGSRLSINLHPAPSSQHLTLPIPLSMPLPMSMPLQSLLTHTHSLTHFSLSICFNTLTIRLTSRPNSDRTQERSRPSSDPSGVALRTAARDTVTSHSCSSLLRRGNAAHGRADVPRTRCN